MIFGIFSLIVVIMSYYYNLTHLNLTATQTVLSKVRNYLALDSKTLIMRKI